MSEKTLSTQFSHAHHGHPLLAMMYCALYCAPLYCALLSSYSSTTFLIRHAVFFSFSESVAIIDLSTYKAESCFLLLVEKVDFDLLQEDYH